MCRSRSFSNQKGSSIDNLSEAHLHAFTEDRTQTQGPGSDCIAGKPLHSCHHCVIVEELHNWRAKMDDCKLFRRNRQGTRGCGVVLCVKECYDCLDLDDGDDRIECLWVRIKGKANTTEIVEEVYYRVPKSPRRLKRQKKYSIRRSHNC